MSKRSLWLMTVFTLLAFAANSLLCRLALVETDISAGWFAVLRTVSAALCLSGICLVRYRRVSLSGTWWPAVALSLYLLGFSFAYKAVDTGTGALLLFAMVQLTMIGVAIRRGSSLNTAQWLGLITACTGLVWLLAPGAQPPPIGVTLQMLAAGAGWAAYSILGQKAVNPLAETAAHFMKALVIVVPVSVVVMAWGSEPVVITGGAGAFYAVLSGAVASGLGYALWYRVLPQLSITTAAMSQLTVPVIAAVMGVVVLAEPVTLRLLGASVLVLGGIAVFTLQRR